MDKKSIVKDLIASSDSYKCFRSWLLNAGKEDIENGSSEHSEI